MSGPSAPTPVVLRLQPRTVSHPHDRALTIMVCASLLSHAVAVIAALVLFHERAMNLLDDPRHPIRLVYEPESSRSRAPSIAERVRQITRSASLLPASAAGGAGTMPSPQAVDELVRVRIGTYESSGAGLPGAAGESAGANRWVSAIDLTNIVAAAQGNPVLLSYFSAIREQIQRVASGQAWLPTGEHAGGIECVGFTLSREGAIQSASVVSTRSTASPVLRDAALRIVQSAGPFPPFPPSFRESSKTIIVPLEFVLGGS